MEKEKKKVKDFHWFGKRREKIWKYRSDSICTCEEIGGFIKVRER